MILFFDTETTGKADFKSEPHLPHQPRLVQFAAMITEDDGKEISTVSLIVKPVGFEIPDEATGFHGITTYHALKRGVDIAIVRGIYREWWEAADLVVGHNIDFDMFIMDGELFRKFGGPKAWGQPRDIFCTMHAMTHVCKLPPAYPGADYKWPKLEEAYSHAFGKPLEGAHDAMADVKATRDIYFWFKQQQQTQTPNDNNPAN